MSLYLPIDSKTYCVTPAIEPLKKLGHIALLVADVFDRLLAFKAKIIYDYCCIPSPRSKSLSGTKLDKRTAIRTALSLVQT